MSDPPITDWFASLYAQSETTIAMVLELLRQDGEDISEYVIVVADMTDEATRFFVDQLGDGPSDPAMPGFVGAIPMATIARVLRMIDAEDAAIAAEKPLDAGLMRLLIAAGGQLQCADLRSTQPAIPMTRGGTA